MRRKYYREDDSLERLITAIVLLYFLFLAGQYFTNRANFWKWLIYGLLFVVLAVMGVLGWSRRKADIKRKRAQGILKEIHIAGLEDYIKNFINRFGFEGRRGRGWNFRNHFFDWERIDDLERYLLEKNINLKTDKGHREIFSLLASYIQEKEEGLTRESIKKEPQKLANLTGAEFEKLVYRLYIAMGYSTEWIGKSGDQGGDLIANKNGERLLIQAKCYRDWSTGNGAVQQVVAAMKYYDCKESVVITTSYFTPEAIALSKVNNVDLISKKRLQEMLLKYLNESWS